MKRTICLLAAAALLLTGCNDVTTIDPEVVYGDKTTTSDGDASQQPVAPSQSDAGESSTVTQPQESTSSSAPQESTSESDSTEPQESTQDTTASSPTESVPADKPMTEPAVTTTVTLPEETTTARPEEVDVPIEKSDEQQRLEQLIAKNGTVDSDRSPEVIPLFFGDLDSDGTQELLAVYGGLERFSDSSSRYHWGEVWFASSDEAVRLDKDRTGDYAGIELINNADGVFLKFEDMYMTGTSTNWWKLNNSDIVSMEIDGFAQMNLRYTDSGELIANHSTYDMSSMNIGHTWKIYWYYYSAAEGKFIQYDAKDISEKTFLKYSGAKAALQRIKSDEKGYEPVRYLLFDNGIIAVNCISGKTVDENGDSSHVNNYFLFSTAGGKLTDITYSYYGYNEGHYITRSDYDKMMEEYNNGL